MNRPARAHPLWLAFVVHRVSGVVLVLFLPVHFWLLSMALTQADRLDTFLALTETWPVKLAEGGLVLLLALHTFGGLRLIALEHLGWTSRRKGLTAGAAGLAVLVAGGFLLGAAGS